MTQSAWVLIGNTFYNYQSSCSLRRTVHVKVAFFNIGRIRITTQHITKMFTFVHTNASERVHLLVQGCDLDAVLLRE